MGSNSGLQPGVTRIVHYNIDDVWRISGRALSIAKNASLTRVDSNMPPAIVGDDWVGVTQHVLYSDAQLRATLSSVSAAETGPCAVLIPISKSNTWWGLGQDERLGLMRASARSRGHFEIGTAYAARIYRRLLHCRYLPHSMWDFLTYFEFAPEHTDDFRALLAELRDPERNPEWRYVEHETEIWMTKRGSESVSG